MESPLPPSSLNTGKAASVITRRPVGIIEGDDNGLASVAEISVGVHKHNNYYYQQPPLYARICGGTNRRNSLKNLSNGSSLSSGVASPRSGFNKFYIDARFEEIHQPYFLEACYLCRKTLSGNRDIFMYRGDTPFCSEECRQKQIEIDESKEKNWNLSATRKALRNKNKESQKSASSSSSSKNQNYAYRAAGTTVAAA